MYFSYKRKSYIICSIYFFQPFSLHYFLFRTYAFGRWTSWLVPIIKFFFSYFSSLNFEFIFCAISSTPLFNPPLNDISVIIVLTFENYILCFLKVSFLRVASCSCSLFSKVLKVYFYFLVSIFSEFLLGEKVFGC